MCLDQEILPLAEETEPSPPIEPGVGLETDPARLLQQACCIAYEDCLSTLASTHVPASCGQCGSNYSINASKIGTAMYLTWVCIM